MFFSPFQGTFTPKWPILKHATSKTFSHRSITKTSARVEKRMVTEMVRCLKDKNQAGLYGVITIKDDGDLHTHKLGVKDSEVPEIFKLF